MKKRKSFLDFRIKSGATYNEYYNLVRKFRRINEKILESGGAPVDAELAAKNVLLGQGTYYSDLLRSAKNGRYYKTGNDIRNINIYERMKNLIDSDFAIAEKWESYVNGEISWEYFKEFVKERKKKLDYLLKGGS